MNMKLALDIYSQHLDLAAVNGQLFRKTVRIELMVVLGCSPAAASTIYNNCKKAIPVVGLGRAVAQISSIKKHTPIVIADESDTCYTVLEVNSGRVCQQQSFILQGDASEQFDFKVKYWPNTTWVLIKGLGPNSAEKYKLHPPESEIKRNK